MGTRDDMCGMDVAQMEDLGGFAQEISVFGCAYKANNSIFYRVTDNPNELYIFYKNCYQQEIYPTLPEIFTERHIIPAGQREAMVFEAKKSCARLLQASFNVDFWQCFDNLTALPASNHALQLLTPQQHALEGRYASDSLNLFEVFADYCLERHCLTLESHQTFSDWIAANRERMVDDWIIKERYERTFYGFGYYKDENDLHVQVDTEPFNLMLKQQDMLLEGFHVTPLLQKTLQFKENRALPTIRKNFTEWLKDTLIAFAIPVERLLDTSPRTSLSQETTAHAKLSERATKTINYYNALWRLL